MRAGRGREGKRGERGGEEKEKGKAKTGKRRDGEGRGRVGPQAKACPPELFSWRRRWPLRRSRSFKVADLGANRKLICDFLLVLLLTYLISCTVSEIQPSTGPKSLYLAVDYPSCVFSLRQRVPL